LIMLVLHNIFWQFLNARMHQASRKELDALRILCPYRGQPPGVVRELLMEAIGHLNDVLTQAELEHRARVGGIPPWVPVVLPDEVSADEQPSEKR